MRAHALNVRFRGRGARGHTLVEMMIVVVTMTVVLGGVLTIMRGARDAWQLTGSKSRLQESGRRMLEKIVSDLRHSGLTTVAGQNYPAIWERPLGPESTPRGALVATMNYSDESLVSEVFAYNGDGDHIARNAGRVADEMVFQLPQDLDGNGTPLDANGNLEWGPQLFSYRVVQDAEGRPWLYRNTEVGGALVDQRIVGQAVKSITFDVVFNDRSLRFGNVDIVLYLEEVNGNGQRVTAEVEGSVNLRNTREL